MDQNQEKAQAKTNCCIVGGGPAGMMLGFLLARGGVDVIVLEQHEDFFRDFRGDTIHPSTMDVMNELGLLNEFLKVPHQEIENFNAVFDDLTLKVADFTHLKTALPVLSLMPQWDFLKFLQNQAARYPAFRLMMQANATDVVRENGKVVGVMVETKDGPMQVDCNLVVATDGRHSVMREKAGLKVIASGVPIDVLWFRIPRQSTDPGQILGRFMYGKIMVMLDRDDYWQCAYIIEKGGNDKIKQNGLEAFRKDVSAVAPFLTDRVNEIRSWDDIKLLSVDIDHLEQWYTSGLLCIGDAAHAMSPIGGVGINLAIQDAVATANILYQTLFEKKVVGIDLLRAVQKRRTYPTRFIQKMQIFIQNNVLSKRVVKNAPSKPPLFIRIINMFPILRRIPARIIGLGVRPEHVQTPAK